MKGKHFNFIKHSKTVTLQLDTNTNKYGRTPISAITLENYTVSCRYLRILTMT